MKIQIPGWFIVLHDNKQSTGHLLGCFSALAAWKCTVQIRFAPDSLLESGLICNGDYNQSPTVDCQLLVSQLLDQSLSCTNTTHFLAVDAGHDHNCRAGLFAMEQVKPCFIWCAFGELLSLCQH
ncbi:hypothetical protein D3C77_497140 [compost metagenome]